MPSDLFSLLENAIESNNYEHVKFIANKIADKNKIQDFLAKNQKLLYLAGQNCNLRLFKYLCSYLDKADSNILPDEALLKLIIQCAKNSSSDNFNYILEREFQKGRNREEFILIHCLRTMFEQPMLYTPSLANILLLHKISRGYIFDVTKTFRIDSDELWNTFGNNKYFINLLVKEYKANEPVAIEFINKSIKYLEFARKNHHSIVPRNHSYILLNFAAALGDESLFNTIIDAYLKHPQGLEFLYTKNIILSVAAQHGHVNIAERILSCHKEHEAIKSRFYRIDYSSYLNHTIIPAVAAACENNQLDAFKSILSFVSSPWPINIIIRNNKHRMFVNAALCGYIEILEHIIDIYNNTDDIDIFYNKVLFSTSDFDDALKAFSSNVRVYSINQGTKNVCKTFELLLNAINTNNNNQHDSRYYKLLKLVLNAKINFLYQAIKNGDDKLFSLLLKAYGDLPDGERIFYETLSEDARYIDTQYTSYPKIFASAIIHGHEDLVVRALSAIKDLELRDNMIDKIDYHLRNVGRCNSARNYETQIMMLREGANMQLSIVYPKMELEEDGSFKADDIESIIADTTVKINNFRLNSELETTIEVDNGGPSNERAKKLPTP
jgi:hypothetical protein